MSIQMRDYKKGIVVYGDGTKLIKDKLKAKGGTWNDHLTNDDGTKFGGWIFPKKDKPIIQNYLELKPIDNKPVEKVIRIISKEDDDELTRVKKELKELQGKYEVNLKMFDKVNENIQGFKDTVVELRQEVKTLKEENTRLTESIERRKELTLKTMKSSKENKDKYEFINNKYKQLKSAFIKLQAKFKKQEDEEDE